MSVGLGQPEKLDRSGPDAQPKKNKPLYWFNPRGEKVEQVDGQRIVVREDGRVEQVCDHGVGHPIGHYRRNGWDASWMGVHGCCRCCSLAKFHLEGLGRGV